VGKSVSTSDLCLLFIRLKQHRDFEEKLQDHALFLRVNALVYNKESVQMSLKYVL
jgi:hypothetical protein